MNARRITGLYTVIDSYCVKLAEAGQTAEKLLEGGARIIQLRAKGAAGSETLQAAREVRAATLGKALFIVNDRADIAMLSGADGVHLGQDDIPLAEARGLMPSAIIGISTHNIEEARAAVALGADYISFGPIFPTTTKKDADVPKGLERLRSLALEVRVPVVAIGGITADTAASVIEASASSVAIISDILLAENITERAREIISRIKPAC